LPTPSELDDWPGLNEALEELLAEKRAKEAAQKGNYPTAMALVQARAMKRVAVKYADLGLARRATSLHKETLSALKKGQSALSNPREFNSGEGTPKSEKRVVAGPSRIDGVGSIFSWLSLVGAAVDARRSLKQPTGCRPRPPMRQSRRPVPKKVSSPKTRQRPPQAQHRPERDSRPGSSP
jgi:hypothetical protein